MSKKWLWWAIGAIGVYLLVIKKKDSGSGGSYIGNMGVLAQPTPESILPVQSESGFIPEVEREFETERPAPQNEPVTYEVNTVRPQQVRPRVRPRVNQEAKVEATPEPEQEKTEITADYEIDPDTAPDEQVQYD